MEKMMDQGKAFFRMAETFLPGADGAPRRLGCLLDQGPGRHAEGLHAARVDDGGNTPCTA